MVRLVYGGIALTLCSITAVINAQERSDWRVSAGMGLAYSPDYLGANTSGTGLRPIVSVFYKNIGFSTAGASTLDAFSTRATPPGVSLAYSPTDQLRFGLAVRVDAGRAESSSPALKGLGDIRQTARASLFMNYKLSEQYIVSAGAMPDLLGRNGGISFNASLSTIHRLNPDWMLVGSVGINAANDRWAQTQFGITPAQSATSGLPVYTPGAGIRDVNAVIGVNYKVSNSWTAFGRLNYLQLVGDSANSPITYSKGQAGAFFGIGYRFF